MAASPRSSIVLLLGATAQAVTALFLPGTIAVAVDAAAGAHRSFADVLCPAALLVLAATASTALTLGGAAAGARAAFLLRMAMLRRVLALGLRGQRRYPIGDVISRVVGNAAEAAEASYGVVSIVAGFVIPVCGVAALWSIDWTIGCTFVVGVAPMALVSGGFLKKYGAHQTRYQEVQSDISARLVDAIAGARSIGAMGTTDKETARVLAPLPELAALGRATWEVQRAATWRTSLLMPVTELAVLGVAGIGVTLGRITPGSLVAVAGYTALGIGLLDNLDPLARLARVRASAVRVTEIMTTASGVGGAVAGASLPDGLGALSIRALTVVDGDRLVLDAIDLDVEAGSSVAIVGRSGAGKSALAAVVGRLIDPDAGEVRLDGVPVHTLGRLALSQAVTYAFAQPATLGHTIGDDIRYGLLTAPDGLVERAARAAHAHDFIQRLPDGYDTPLTRLKLSGGERQRMGLARAAARPARVLVLDDATSHLDTVTELLVSRALDFGGTRLIITHRASTAARADLVVWLEAGKVRVVAPHAELWEIPAYRAALAGGPASDDGEDAAHGPIASTGLRETRHE
ncbi:ABC transporter ATP-binding protein [Streptomyces sp. NPDC091265]|uniref:ABC transporter ATP-binding protein n=1 Tax=unclassified Streptomyces TaxID=2593676 RepID=UPI00344FDB6D